jgi:STE24 endopeptidase
MGTAAAVRLSADTTAAEGACADRQLAAARLGAERRRLFLVSSLLSLAVPVVPYLTGAWEALWYALAAACVPAASPAGCAQGEAWLPFALRTGVFLLVFYLACAAVLLPVSAYGGYVLPRAFGLVRQPFHAWALDWLKATLIGTVLGLVVASAFLLAVVHFDRGWWLVFGSFLSLGLVALVFVTPYVLVPLFFRMRPLADREMAARLRALAHRAGADVRDVCSLDFSRRTAEANAAVIGMGRSRRVVLADTLLAEFTADEVDAVVAHEIGHHVHRDVVWLIGANLATLWLGLLVASRLAEPALPLLSLPSLAYVPGFPMLVGVAEVFFLLVMPFANWWSRRLETGADRFALRLTARPAAFAGAMQRLACQNLVELTPPRWSELLLGSHPALCRRIALAESWVDRAS